MGCAESVYVARPRQRESQPAGGCFDYFHSSPSREGAVASPVLPTASSDSPPYRASPPTGTYKGSRNRAGQPHGTGVLTWADRSYYSGSFCDGNMQGLGHLVFHRPSVRGTAADLPAGGAGGRGGESGSGYYVGEFHLNAPHGHGKMVWHNNSTVLAVASCGHVGARGGADRQEVNREQQQYEGMWALGRKHGPGLMRWPNGDSFDGTWHHDVIHGSGVYKKTVSNQSHLGGGAGPPYNVHTTHRGDWFQGKKNGRFVRERYYSEVAGRYNHYNYRTHSEQENVMTNYRRKVTYFENDVEVAPPQVIMPPQRVFLSQDSPDDNSHRNPMRSGPHAAASDHRPALPIRSQASCDLSIAATTTLETKKKKQSPSSLSISSHLERKEAAAATQLPDALLCVVCQSKQKQMAFQPCAHVCCCIACASKVTECPLCRYSITSRMVVFL